MDQVRWSRSGRRQPTLAARTMIRTASVGVAYRDLVRAGAAMEAAAVAPLAVRPVTLVGGGPTGRARPVDARASSPPYDVPMSPGGAGHRGREVRFARAVLSSPVRPHLARASSPRPSVLTSPERSRLARASHLARASTPRSSVLVSPERRHRSRPSSPRQAPRWHPIPWPRSGALGPPGPERQESRQRSTSPPRPALVASEERVWHGAAPCAPGSPTFPAN